MASQMMEILRKERPDVAKKVNAPALLSALYKSEVGALMVKQNISATKKPVYQWSLVPDAYDLTIDELYGLYDARNRKCTLALLGGKYPWIPTLLKSIEWAGPIKKNKKVAQKRVALKSTKKELLPVPEQMEKEMLTDEGKKKIIDVIEEAVSSSLGVKVKIDCDINVRFGLLK